MKQFKQTQKFRIILSGVAVYTTAKQLRSGLFGYTFQNVAAQKAMDALTQTRSSNGAADQCAVGICGTWDGIQVQLDMI